MERHEVEKRLGTLEARRRDAQERMARSRERLQHLEEERDELLGEAALAQQTLADLEEYEARLQAELARARVEEARGAFAEAVQARDASVGRASEALGALAAALADVEARRRAVTETHRALAALDEAAPGVPPEPQAFRDQRREAARLVERELDGELRRLEADLVEAAVRSPQPSAIEELPEHLQDVARRRKQALTAQPARRRG
jgi:chromosome segregation ATPase